MSKLESFRITLLCAAAGIAGLSQGAAAQTTGAPEAAQGGARDAAEPDSNNQLTDIVVTAERRETSLQRTPISVVAFTQDDLAKRGTADLASLSQFTPGLSIGGGVEGGTSRPVFMIRGIGQTSGRESVERGVGLYVDDVYYPRTTGSLLQLLDVDRVEVLRGPQGTLFGRNTTGGAIRYITRKPTDTLEGSVTGTIGSFKRVDVTGLINIPLSDTVATRFQVGSFQRDGYVKLLNNNERRGDNNDVVARGMIQFNPSSDLTIDASLTYARSKSYQPPLSITSLSLNQFQTNALNAYLTARGQPQITTTNDSRFVTGDPFTTTGTCFIGDNSLGASSANGSTIFNDQRNYCNYGDSQRLLTGTLDINWRLGDDWSLRSLSAYQRGRSETSIDWSGLGTFLIEDNVKTYSLSQEIQLKYAGSLVDGVAGLFYFKENPEVFSRSRRLAYFGPVSPLSGQCCDGFNRNRDLHTESLGAFGQLTLHPTEDLSLIAGVRYSTDRKSIAVSRTDRPTGNLGAVLQGSDRWNSFNYRLTAQYQWSPTFMTYATVSTGFRSGGFNDDPAATTQLNGGITAYDPEKVQNFEVGMRSELFDRHLRFNLTGFYMKYKDMQLATPIFDPTAVTPQPVLALVNAGKIELSGVEAESVLVLSDAFRLNASVATLWQKWAFLENGSSLLIPSTCTNPAAPTFATCDAQDIARAPKVQFTVGGQYDIGLGEAGSLQLNANYAHISSLQTSNSVTNSLLLPGYGITNLRVQFNPSRERWHIALFGTNVFDKKYATSGANFASFFGLVNTAPGRPAEWGIELGAKF
jgi:iron complex outermembrane receptor protein